MKNSLFKDFIKGIWKENPVLVLLLGTCPTLALTSSAANGLGMGIATSCVLTGSNLVISLIASITPQKIRIPVYIVVIAAFVTVVDLLLQAYAPAALYEALGIFIPLIVVNCIVLGRAEAFASKNGVLASALDGLFQGCGYTVALVIICVIRELLGSGTFGGGLLNGGEGIRIIPQDMAAMQLVMPVGGFLVLGCVIALSQWLMRRMNDRKEGEK
jgi:electron transport complex protein RnfE